MAEDDRFCPNCGRPVHETARVPTPEADVPMPPPPEEDIPAPGSRGGSRIKKVVKGDRLDKIEGRILAMVFGIPLLLTILWFVLQFFIWFVNGFIGAF